MVPEPRPRSSLAHRQARPQAFGREEFRPVIDGITIGLQALLAFIGALTLGIGGVGVMNIMLVSVDERVREIGLRMALGARRRHIRGIALAYALSAAVGTLPVLGPLFKDESGKGDLRLIVSPMTALAAGGIQPRTGCHEECRSTAGCAGDGDRVDWRSLAPQPDVAALLTDHHLAEAFQRGNYTVRGYGAR